VGFSLGALLARWGRGARGVRGAYPLLAFGALVLAPACAYPLLFFADWSYAYLIDGRSVPSAVVLALLLVDAAAPAAGFVLARRALAREALGEDPAAHAVALALAIVPAGAAALLGVLLGPRLAIEGTLAMVRGNFGIAPLWKSPLGYALVWMSACVGAGAWLTARALAAASSKREPAPLRASEPAPAAPRKFLGARDAGRSPPRDEARRPRALRD
jgi:hypothetical protein